MKALKRQNKKLIFILTQLSEMHGAGRQKHGKNRQKAKTRDHAKTQENLINQLLEKNENT